MRQKQGGLGEKAKKSYFSTKLWLAQRLLLYISVQQDNAIIKVEKEKRLCMLFSNQSLGGYGVCLF